MREPNAAIQKLTRSPQGWGWLRILLLLLLVEKVAQHVVVTIAFVTDLRGIRASVALPYQMFIVAGAVLAALFAVAAWGVVRGKSWAPTLVIALALTDIVGEVVAQFDRLITLNVSLIVATALLILALFYHKRGNPHDGPEDARGRSRSASPAA